MSQAAIVVLAKAPVPGAVKTRLCPPLYPEQAALLAEAALMDTLAAVAATPARARVLALEGEPGPWLEGGGIEVIPQRGGDLGTRIAAALEDAGPPALAIGMDTPQLTPALLAAALDALTAQKTDAVLGPAADGGYWAIGVRRAAPGAFDGVSMSAPHTCAAQRARLEDLGLRVAALPALRDVDRLEDVRAVAAAAPGTRFAAAAARVLSPTAAEEPASGPR